MRKPAGKAPFLCFVLPVINIYQLHIRIGIVGRNLCGQGVHHIQRSPFASSADQADHRMPCQIDLHRNIIKRLILLLDQTRLFRQ